MTSCAAAAAKRRIMRQQRKAERARETKTIKERERGGERSECVRVRCKVIIYSTSLRFTRRPTDPNKRTAQREPHLLSVCLRTTFPSADPAASFAMEGGRGESDGRRGNDLWQFFESSCLRRLERAASSGQAHVSQLRRPRVRPSAFSLFLRRVR